MKRPEIPRSPRLDFFTRKVVYLGLQACLALAYVTAWSYSRIRRNRRPPPDQVRSIAAVWYWPPDFPSASRTRLGTWKDRFEGEGIRFDNYHVGAMEELVREYEAGSWTARYWFYTKVLWRRWRQFFVLRRYDVVWIDRWFLPHYPLRRPLFEQCVRRMVPYLVVDSSDGTDYVGNPSLVLGVMALADKITVAYKGLYEFYRPRFAKVERFEYPILEEGYRVRVDHRDPKRFTIGWMGSPSNFRYLKDIEGELQRVALQRPFRMVVICRQEVELNIPGADIAYRTYGSDYHELIASFDIGLSPFTVDDFGTAGKIAMKHQEFLLCGVPQVCSPVGISEHVVDGVHALVAARIEDWSPAILRLMDSEALRASIAANGRQLCLEHYTVDGQWPRVRDALTVF
jgi:glycosyltransferase involved in cell wall biosynthesis